MSILDMIMKDKEREVSLKKSILPVSQLEASLLFERPTFSLCKRLKDINYGIIAEHKRRSPSKAVINQSFSVEEVVFGYEQAGACGVSVLTDAMYFGGSLEDLLLARASTELPILRKEFIMDPYQIIEAKAYGADAILLIAAVLSRAQIKTLSEFAKSLGLEVLLEVHNQAELHKALMPSLDMIGVNNRNLKSFEVNLETSKYLADKIPQDFIKVSESGIGSVETIIELGSYAYKGFLIGEAFMKTPNPEMAASRFINKLPL